jgi:hypothetical protein
MAILKIRDAEGNIQEILTIKGNDYVLTDADKQEIADIAASKIVIPDTSAYMTEAQVLALIQANMPVNGDEESY